MSPGNPSHSGTSLYPWRRKRYYLAETVARDGEVLPQVREREKLFEAAGQDKTKVGNTAGITIFCKLHGATGSDSFRAPDLNAYIAIGNAQVGYRGPDNENDLSFSISGVSLTEGDRVSVEVFDRDFWSSEAIGSGTLVYEGFFPLQVNARASSLECRSLSKEKTAAAITNAVRKMEEAVRKVEGTPARPNLEERDSGYWDAMAISEAWWLVESLAGFVGWTDERVARAAERLKVVDERWSKAATKAVEGLVRRLPPPGEKFANAEDGLKVRVVETRCNADEVKGYKKWEPISFHGITERVACVVEVEIEWQGEDDPFKNPRDPFNHAAFVTADGFDVEAAVLQGPEEKPFRSKETQKGERIRYLLLPSQDIAVGSHPGTAPTNKDGPSKLLRLPIWGSSTVLLRLE